MTRLSLQKRFDDWIKLAEGQARLYAAAAQSALGLHLVSDCDAKPPGLPPALPHAAPSQALEGCGLRSCAEMKEIVYIGALSEDLTGQSSNGAGLAL